LQLGAPLFAQSGKPISSVPRAAQAQSSMEQHQSAAQAAFNKLVDEYFLASWKAYPNSATDEGIHDYDDKMPDPSAAGVSRRIAEEKQFLHRFEAVDPSQLNKTSRIDLKMLIADAESELLELQDIQGWQRNPDHYSSIIFNSVFSLIKRNFAPLETRLKAVIAREKAAPSIIAAAKANLQKTPKIYTEIALEQLPDTIDFFKTTLPPEFADVKNEQLKSEFETANNNVIAQLKDYQTFLKQDVLPNSVADFAIGKENFRKKLLYNEMVDEPLDKVLADGYTELHRLQKEFVQTAAKIDPSKPAPEVYRTISLEHCAPDQLFNQVQKVLDNLHDQCRAVVTIPAEDVLKVEETPPCERATTFASMDAPGPFEKKAKEAYYFVTLPEKGWDAKRVEEHMRFYCTLDLINTSVHEAYPGHYIQGLWVKQAPSKTRKLLGCGSNIEGWAHYCEQMMVEEQPDNQKLKLVQLHDALLRACRYIVGIQMHTAGMTMDQGKQFFVSEGYQEPANADREAKRGTSDPTYLIYTLGKLQILSLRDDYKKAKGNQFSLKQFHDDFLSQGMAPVKLIREALLSPDEKSL